MKKLQLLSTVAGAVLLTAGVCAAQTSGNEETHKAPHATSDQSKSGTMGHEKSEKSQAAQEKSQAAESAKEKEESRTGAQEKRGVSSQRESKESAASKDKSKAARDDKNEAGTEKQSGARTANITIRRPGKRTRVAARPVRTRTSQATRLKNVRVGRRAPTRPRPNPTR